MYLIFSELGSLVKSGLVRYICVLVYLIAGSPPLQMGVPLACLGCSEAPLSANGIQCFVYQRGKMHVGVTHALKITHRMHIRNKYFKLSRHRAKCTGEMCNIWRFWKKKRGHLVATF